MLKIIKDLHDPLIHLVKDDPVRPAIPTASRIHDHAEILVLVEDDQAQAVVCVAYLDAVPTTETELGKTGDNVAAFYTIWSYAPGAGRRMIRAARQHISQTRPTIKTYVTLSPKTEMARKFHLSNGASVLADNETTVNYLYD
jgi:DICT domain-containing protein